MPVFCDGHDWYIADTPQQATEAWEEWTGESRLDYFDANEPDGGWVVVPPDEELSIAFESIEDMTHLSSIKAPQPCRWRRLQGEFLDGIVITATAAQWEAVARQRPAFLCSVEW